VEDLPPVDYIVISHDHFDHLEMRTTQYFAQMKTQFIVPLGVRTHLTYWGVPEQNIIERDWWGSHRDGELEVILTPSRHYSGRSGFLANDTLWGSFVIRDTHSSIYYSGDSGYDSHFKDIAQRYGPFQIALVENGQYHEISRQIHLFPEDTLQAFKDLNAQTLVPIHWGMFALSQHPWDEPIKTINQLASEHGIDLYMPKLGEIFSTQRPRTLERWWEP
jgi:L-ascorbate metabolism protein UlaG (beta-lactamase superfamily)